MSRSGPGRSARARHRLVRRLRGADDRADGGFVLLESIIAISLITVVMSALGVLFVVSVANATHERTRGVAVQVATTALDGLSANDPTSLVSGRTAALVDAQLASAQARSAPVSTYLASMTAARDTDPNGSGTPTVPTTPTTQQIGHRTYTLNQYLGWCKYSLPADAVADCTKSATACPDSGGEGCYLRAVIAVSWDGPHCTALSCTYVTAQLISSAIDPTFLMNQQLPPAPVVAAPGSQVSAVGDDVSLQLLVEQDTGVPTFTWSATGLPAGLALSPFGLISGSPTTQHPTPASVTVTVTDAFLRQASATFTWKVYPKLEITTPDPQDPPAQAGVVGEPIPTYPLQATGGQGAPYTWSVATGALPPGLTVNSPNSGDGSITGTPTAAGQYTFSLAVTDASGSRSATTRPVTWTVTYPPIAASNPGAQIGTVGADVDLELSASGGSGDYTWTDPTNSLSGSGLSLTTDGHIVGTLTAARDSFDVSVTVTDTTARPRSEFTKTVAFGWSVVPAPSIDSPGAATMTATGSANVVVGYSCPNGPCRLSLSGAPAGVALSSSTVGTGSGTVTIAGTVGASAAGAYTPTVQITDSSSVSSTGGPGSWTVNAPPTLTVAPAAPGGSDAEFAPGGTVSGQATTAGGTGPYVYAFSGTHPSWLSIDPSTGAITGTAPGSRGRATFTVVATDANGVSASAPTTWYVDDLSWNPIPDQATAKSRSSRHTNKAYLDLATYVGGGPTGGATYALGDHPSWVSINGSVLTARAPTRTDSGTVAVSVTDSMGNTQRTSFTWSIT